MSRRRRSSNAGEHRPNISSREIIRGMKEELRRIMLQTCADPPLLAEVVGQGYATWERTMRRGFSPYPVPEQALKAAFAFFCTKLVEIFGAQPDAEPMKVAKLVLDNIEFPSAPTEAEIDAAWTLDDMSSEGGRRQYAELVGEAPQTHLAKLIKQDRDKAKHGVH